MRARLLFFVLVLLTFASPAYAQEQPAAPDKAQQLAQRQATYTWEKQANGPDLLQGSFSFVDVADAAIRQKLGSGLPTIIVMRAYVLREGESDPVALAARTCKVRYDLWGEVYGLTISEAGKERNAAAYNVEGVLRNCFEVRKMTLADRSLLTPGKAHFLGVIVEVNPVNAQMVEQMRKWVTRPAGSTGINPGDALFGSFVGLFVRQIGTADRTLRFRTQSLTP